MSLVRVNKKQINEYAAIMRIKQDNKCACCGNKFTMKDNAVVDHDHFTGHLRGLLHRSCNSAEGRVLTMAERMSKGDGVRFIVRVAEKIRKHKQITKVESRMVNAGARGHSGVSAYSYIVGLALYYIKYAQPKHSLIHPTHHLKFERHDGIPMDKRNWR